MDSFITLPMKKREQLLTEAAKRHGRMSPKIVEKDLWVCWTLNQLFSLPEIAPYLTFKGGTSLSKAYGLIDRFSEDCDLTLDKEYLGIHAGDWPEDTSSRKARQEFRKRLDKACSQVLDEQLLPLLKRQFSLLLGDSNWSIAPSESDPLTILLHYPRAVSYGMGFGRGSFGGGAFGEGEFGYIKPAVRLEFGARGDSFPVKPSSFIPYIAEILPEMFDNAAGIMVTVSTLEAERTFWEKITILHDLYHKEKDKPLKQTIARHYYDTVMLARKGIAANASKRRDLLEAVVKNSRLNCTDSNDSPTYKAYDALLQNNIKLVPPAANVTNLQKDYSDMQENGMFFGAFPSFEEIVAELGELEDFLNRR